MTQHYTTNDVVSSSGGGGGGSTTVTTPIVQNVTVTAANIEQSHTFPANTKTVLLQVRGNDKIKLAFGAGLSGSQWFTVWPNGFWSQGDITAASTTIYFQSPSAGIVLELLSWS